MSVVLRPATAADYPLFARLHPELGTGDAVPSVARWTAELVPQTWIAEREGVAVAFLFWQLLSETAYVRQMVVAPDARRSGVARALLIALARDLRARGIRRWALNVKPDNVPALALYESLGMRRAWVSVSLRMSWTVIDRLPTRDGTFARLLTPADDAAFETLFGLPLGQLVTGRRAGRFVIGAFAGVSAAGLALFDASFPGAFPFHARSVEVARALLEQMRTVAQTETFKVVVENDEPLAQTLLDAGALLDLRFLHLRGDVPA